MVHAVRVRPSVVLARPSNAPAMSTTKCGQPSSESSRTPSPPYAAGAGGRAHAFLPKTLLQTGSAITHEKCEKWKAPPDRHLASSRPVFGSVVITVPGSPAAATRSRSQVPPVYVVKSAAVQAFAPAVGPASACVTSVRPATRQVSFARAPPRTTSRVVPLVSTTSSSGEKMFARPTTPLRSCLKPVFAL